MAGIKLYVFRSLSAAVIKNSHATKSLQVQGLKPQLLKGVRHGPAERYPDKSGDLLTICDLTSTRDQDAGNLRMFFSTGSPFRLPLHQDSPASQPACLYRAQPAVRRVSF